MCIWVVFLATSFQKELRREERKGEGREGSRVSRKGADHTPQNHRAFLPWEEPLQGLVSSREGPQCHPGSAGPSPALVCRCCKAEGSTLPLLFLCWDTVVWVSPLCCT